MTQNAMFPNEMSIPFPFTDVSPEIEPSFPPILPLAQVRMSSSFPSPVQTVPAIPDMNSARAVLEPFRSTAMAMEQAAFSVSVIDDASMSVATSLAGQSKKAFKQIEDARKTYLTPLHDHVKQVNGLAKEITAPLERVESTLKKKIAAHAAAQELERRKAEESSRREAKEQQRRLDEEAAAAGVEAPVIPEVLALETKPQVIRTEGGTSYMQSRWTFKLDALSRVPLDFMMLDERKVRDAIRGGIRNIPGLTISEEKTIAIRS